MRILKKGAETPLKHLHHFQIDSLAIPYFGYIKVKIESTPQHLACEAIRAIGLSVLRCYSIREAPSNMRGP